MGSGTHLTLVVEQNDPPTDPGLALIGHNAESGTCKLITAGNLHTEVILPDVIYNYLCCISFVKALPDRRPLYIGPERGVRSASEAS